MKPLDKVILYGVYDGLNLGSDGSRDILVTLENGDRVDIPQYFAKKASDFVEKDKLKLKDVIARIKNIDLDSQELWLNEILNKLGSDYGSLKYRAGYEQGKFDCAMERDKVTVPQFVADWYEEHKSNLDYELWDYVSDWEDQKPSEFKEWFNKSDKAFQTLVNMHQFGYTVEKEPKYTVKIKSVNQYLVRNTDEDFLGFLQSRLKSKFTRKELEEAGFGEVFNSPLFEVEEVDE
nr:MAG TPA: Protein of unknown function (DUF1642) [Caudoviricetes sp.]